MFETLREVLVNKLMVVSAEITPDATIDDLDLDSLAILELAVILDKDFGIKISDDEFAKAETVQDIVDLMEKRSATSV